MKIENCDFILHRIPLAKRSDPISQGISIIYSDEKIRIMTMFDIGASPEKGKDIVRVDVFI